MTVRAAPARDVTLQGHYAGAVTRAGAFAIDVLVLTGAFSVMTTVAFWLLGILVGRTIEPTDSNLLVLVSFVFWQFLYFAVPWAASGKTFGMAVAGIRVVRGEGSPLDPGRAVVRTLAFPLSFLLFGLGFTGVVLGRRRRALHDVVADTAVVYSWDARAARLRFLAKQGPEAAAPTSHQEASVAAS